MSRRVDRDRHVGQARRIDLDVLVAIAPDGKTSVVELENFWIQKGRGILKFAGVDGPEAARNLVGYDFAVSEAERVPLPKDQYYDWELEGCTVKVGAESIGQVNSVLKTGGAEILVVSDNSGKERLIPLADSIVVEVDPARKTIVVDPPEGLLDL